MTFRDSSLTIHRPHGSRIALSKRVADATKLQESLARDPKFQQQFLSTGNFDNQRMTQAIEYISSAYSCSRPDAEEALLHFLRGIQQEKASSLSNRVAQTSQIVIPPTTDNPAGRTVPVEKVQAPQAPVGPSARIDTAPAETPAEKTEDLTKPVVQPSDNRQQKVIDAISSCKVSVGELAKAMFGIELMDEHLGKAVSKLIETVSSLTAEQTAETVQNLASPLIGEA